MTSIRYASLDEYWPAVRARAFAAEVRSLGGGPGFTTPRRLTYAKNMEILAEWAGVPVSSMPWVNPITYAERLCSAAFSDPAYLTKIMGKRAYFDMCYFQSTPNNITPEPRQPVGAVDKFIEWSRRQPPAQESEEEQEPPAVRVERAERKAEALERQFQACEAMWMSAMARAEEAEEQVRQLKKEVVQVHLADMIARDATQRAVDSERNFLALKAAVDSVLQTHDDVWWGKVMYEYRRGEECRKAYDEYRQGEKWDE